MITKKEFSQALTDNASVVAGVVPVATSSSNGLLSANQYKWINPIADRIITNNLKMVVKAEMSGKISLLCGFMKNYISAGMLYISISSPEEASTVYSKWIVKQGSVNFFYKSNNRSFELYVSGLSSWAECAFIRLTGDINSLTIVSEVPEDATKIQVSD